MLLNGCITLMLGVLINRQWPGSGLWVIGLFVGIEMIFNGWAWIMLAIGLQIGDRAVDDCPIALDRRSGFQPDNAAGIWTAVRMKTDASG